MLAEIKSTDGKAIKKTCGTLGVNFINDKREHFSNERHFGSFFLVTCT